jgi:hypothetical protein
MLKRHLTQAEEHITTGQKNIARQWELIAKLERDKPRRRGDRIKRL